MRDYIVMYLLMVVSIVLGTYITDRHLFNMKNDLTKKWWVFVVGMSLVMAIPIVIVAGGEW